MLCTNNDKTKPLRIPTMIRRRRRRTWLRKFNYIPLAYSVASNTKHTQSAVHCVYCFSKCACIFSLSIHIKIAKAAKKPKYLSEHDCSVFLSTITLAAAVAFELTQRENPKSCLKSCGSPRRAQSDNGRNARTEWTLCTLNSTHTCISHRWIILIKPRAQTFSVGSCLPGIFLNGRLFSVSRHKFWGLLLKTTSRMDNYTCVSCKMCVVDR